MFRNTLTVCALTLASLAISSAPAQAQGARYQVQVRHNYYGITQWWPYGGGSYDAATAQSVINQLRSGQGGGWQYVSYRQVGGGGGGGGQREIWYRSVTKERYLYRDRYGRLYWSGWQSAGTIERPTMGQVQREVQGWLQGDPYKNASGQPLSRTATQIEGFYR